MFGVPPLGGRLKAELQTFNETATTIHPRVGRFGGCTYSLELSFSAAEAPTTKCECQRECSASCVTFGFANGTGLGNRDSGAGPGVFIACPDTRQRAATEAPHRHAFV